MIVNPITKIKYNINNEIGREILYNYIQNYKNGGMMAGIKNRFSNIYTSVKSFITSEGQPTPHSIMNSDSFTDNIEDDVVDKDDVVVEIDTTPSAVLKPPSRDAYKLLPLRKSIQDNLDINIQITNEIIGEADFWERVLNRELNHWENYTKRSSSPRFGRLSPSLLPDYEYEKRRAQRRIQTMRSPGGFRLQTTIDGSLDGFFIDTVPIDY